MIYKKKGKGSYLLQILWTIVSFQLFIDLSKLLVYYCVNHTLGLRTAKIGKSSNVHATVILRQANNIEIGEGCLINHNNVLQAGKVNAKIRIGNYVHTGANVMIIAFNHAFDTREKPTIKQDYYDASVIIEDDVWIGAGTIILKGVRIGRGSVIGAGSVVTRDIPPYSLAAGNPCRVIRKITEKDHMK